jgi:predicted GH43/DUF377 family glycosyl hydrolase
MKLKKYENNPVLSPRADHTWENACACNPGTWYDGEKVIMLYRGGTMSDEHPIYLGMATSRDGYNFERVGTEPVFAPRPHSFDGGCVEDPRMIRFGDMYFITYATRMFFPGAYWKEGMKLNAFNPPLPPETPRAIQGNLTRSALAATRDFKTWYRMGPITPSTVDDRDAIIFPEKINGKFVLLHRPATWIGPAYGCDRPSIWISLSNDMLSWEHDKLLAQPVFDWEFYKIGGNTPPIRTDQGWLTLYHGVGKDNAYRTGVMMLDLEDPTRITARAPEPILEPEADYETRGIVPHVVFPCGTAIIDQTLFVYYGGADTYSCVATTPLEELVDYVMQYPWKE